MNIEIRKFNLIQHLMRIRDEQTIDTVETLLNGVFHTSKNKSPRHVSATDLPSPKLRATKIKKKKKKKMVFTLEELMKR